MILPEALKVESNCNLLVDKCWTANFEFFFTRIYLWRSSLRAFFRVALQPWKISLGARECAGSLSVKSPYAFTNACYP